MSKARRLEIINRLCHLSRDGWSLANLEECKALESQLEATRKESKP